MLDAAYPVSRNQKRETINHKTSIRNLVVKNIIFVWTILAAMMKSLADKDLLIAADEQFAFRVLYERYWEALFYKAIRRLGNEEDARDVVQEIFITLWRNRHRIQVAESLKPYLFTALKYAIIKVVYKKAQKGCLLPLSILELEQYAAKCTDTIEYNELKNTVDNEVARLPDRMRQIYQLSRVSQLKNAEIARHLNISEQTVKNTLSIILKRLKSKVLHLFMSLCL